jgi:hypothetical protein
VVTRPLRENKADSKVWGRAVLYKVLEGWVGGLSGRWQLSTCTCESFVTLIMQKN